MLMVMSTKATGQMIKPMVLVCLSTLTLPDMKVCGKMINNTVMVLRLGTMVPPSIQVIFTKVRSKARESSNGLTAAITKETLSRGSLKALESTILLILTKCTKANSEIAIWKAEELRSGMMAGSMREISRTVKRMVKVLSNGRMEIDILVVGNKESSTVLVYGMMGQMDLKNKVSGFKERGIDGFQEWK